MPPLLSLVIPTMNQVKLVERCLDSFLQNEKPPFTYEIVIVDDGSPPLIQKQLSQSLRRYPARLLLKNHNTGFADTVNQGVDLCQGNYICLVNNDVIFYTGDCLALLLAEAQTRGSCIIGPRLIYPDRRIQHGGIYYVSNKRVFEHEYRYKPQEYAPALSTREVLGVTGALMMTSNEVWRKLGGMDKRFFLSWEDVDFSLRAWAAGVPIIYLGRASAIHAEGTTRFNRSSPKMAFWHQKEVETKRLFYSKWLHRLGGLNDVKLISGESISRLQAKKWQTIITGGPVGTTNVWEL